MICYLCLLSYSGFVEGLFGEFLWGGFMGWFYGVFLCIVVVIDTIVAVIVAVITHTERSEGRDAQRT